MLFEPVIAEFSFDHDGNELVGDLVQPPWPGPYPAVVFVEGSGPGGRDQGSWPTRLAAAGFASLAYDKPGSGASTDDWTRQTIADRAEETVAAVRALAGRDDVLPDAIALIGGSQGGWVAQLAPSLEDTIAAVVTVSGPGVSVLAQEEYRRSPTPRGGLHQHRRPAGAGAAGRAGPASSCGHRRLQSASALAALSCPLLAIFGADDLLVPVEDSVRVITRTLEDAHHTDHEIVVFPRADHNIRIYTGHGPAQISNGHYTPAERAPGFDELIVTWLQRRLRFRSPMP